MSQIQLSTTEISGIESKPSNKLDDGSLNDDEPAHYVNKLKWTEAVVYGLPTVALCGEVFVPRRDTANLPVCEMCKKLYELLS